MGWEGGGLKIKKEDNYCELFLLIATSVSCLRIAIKGVLNANFLLTSRIPGRSLWNFLLILLINKNLFNFFVNICPPPHRSYLSFQLFYFCKKTHSHTHTHKIIDFYVRKPQAIHSTERAEKQKVIKIKRRKIFQRPLLISFLFFFFFYFKFVHIASMYSEGFLSLSYE